MMRRRSLTWLHGRQRGSDDVPIRNLSTACAAWRLSRIAHTTQGLSAPHVAAGEHFGLEALGSHRVLTVMTHFASWRAYQTSRVDAARLPSTSAPD